MEDHTNKEQKMQIPADYLPNCDQSYREAAWKAEQDFAEQAARYNAKQES